MSLARKVSVLFGSAVLLTISATLTFPYLQMSALNEEALLTQGHWVAGTALQAVDLEPPDWSAAQVELERRWAALADSLGLPSDTPQLVRMGMEPAGGFRREALQRLSERPEQRYYWKLQDDGRCFRFALAVRGHPTDRHPTALRGIIDVTLEVPPASGAWNLVVTVLAGASGAVLAILVFYLVTQRLVLSKVTALRKVAEKVTTGDIDVRAGITSGDEFQELSDAFNDMLSHLNSAQEELRKTNRSLDIRLGELAETNVALFESNRLKSEFLANVTHELRTPLVSIIGFAELLRDAWDKPQVDRERLGRYAHNILTSGRSLLDIINDLLDLAKIEAGKMRLHLTQFSLVSLCQDLVDFVRPLADKKNQTLEFDGDATLPEVHGDAGKVRQILYNLLSNAIKFTPAGGAVRLEAVAVGDGQFLLAVSDTGPGIPEEQREHIFEKFRQLDGSTTREHEGTGLGLAITHDLVQMLGGSIELDTAAASGARFVVRLPVVIEDRQEVTRPKISLA